MADKMTLREAVKAEREVQDWERLMRARPIVDAMVEFWESREKLNALNLSIQSDAAKYRGYCDDMNEAEDKLIALQQGIK